MSTFKILALQIGTWSKDNFGNSPVEYLTITDEGVELNFLAPLMGLGEEIGELYAAIDAPLGPDYCANIIDAIADVGIYLADYCKRRNLFPKIDNVNEFQNIGQYGLPIAYGTLLRCELKHAQKIRGMGDIANFTDAARTALTKFYYTLDNVSRRFTGNPIDSIIEKTFKETVAKRNWKANSATGANSEG